MNSTLTGLYEALRDLRASEVQDVDFAKTLLILEEVRRLAHCIPDLSRTIRVVLQSVMHESHAATSS